MSKKYFKKQEKIFENPEFYKKIITLACVKKKTDYLIPGTSFIIPN